MIQLSKDGGVGGDGDRGEEEEDHTEMVMVREAGPSSDSGS